MGTTVSAYEVGGMAATATVLGGTTYHCLPQHSEGLGSTADLSAGLPVH